MRRIVVPFIMLALTAPAAAARPVASPQPTPPTVAATMFLISGRGYGHGVGMSQYGALGYARNGATYDEILTHYYSGTTVGPVPTAVIRVLLAEARPKLTISSTVPFEVVDAAGTIVELPAGPLALGPKLVVDKQPLQTPLVVRPGATTPLRLGDKPYRGVLEVRSDGKRLAVVNRLGLELYLQGVVPGEMPSDWPAEALRAQAVAARSYALAQRLKGKSFDVYSDVRSQVYGGMAAEKPTTNAAVRDTAGQAVLYEGNVATTYFHSTSGGRTADSGEIFARPLPYLVPVDDPYDSLSPYHRWGPVVVPAAKVASGLKVPGPVLDLVMTPGPSGRASTVTVRTARGDTAMKPTDVRFGLGLRSTWFQVGTLSLSRPAAPVVHGGAVRLSGTVRGVAGVTLSALVAGVWQPLRMLAAGAFSVPVKPGSTTIYRLTDAVGRGPSLRVPVSPRVTFDGGAGTVAPPLPGAMAVLQRQEGVRWAELARAPVAADGTYQLGVRLGPGVYRVSVPASGGYAAGVSPELSLG
jgi:stage II sporulation protein D